MLANEMSIAGRTEQEVYAFIDKIINAMVATVKSGLSMPEDDVLPGPIKLHSKAATVYKRAMDDSYQADRGIGALSAYALAASEAAEGGCQAEIGVASSMAAALVATAYDAPSRVVENAAESALEHHLGMTCDPVAGYVQVPCIERCAFGAVKAWTAYAIASNEIASRHRIDLDATIQALAQTAKDMNSKYKETSEAGLALSVVLC
jgi:L-serine deaminase